MKCRKCGNRCIKKGWLKQKYRIKQRYKCTSCSLYQLRDYTNRRYCNSYDRHVIALVSSGMSISCISRYLKFSKPTISRQILRLGNAVVIPVNSETWQTYEVDELHSFIGRTDNAVWITYAFNRRTKKVVMFNVGRRDIKHIKPVINYLKSLNPRKIVTDRLNLYPNLVDPVDHDVGRYRNNRIERANLTLRQHIKRLSRKTLSYSKSEEMLEATLKLYFFWNNWRIGGEGRVGLEISK